MSKTKDTFHLDPNILKPGTAGYYKAIIAHRDAEIERLRSVIVNACGTAAAGGGTLEEVYDILLPESGLNK